jgi:hypothetical protein
MIDIVSSPKNLRDRTFFFFGEGSSLQLSSESASPFTIKEYFRLWIEVKNRKNGGQKPPSRIIVPDDGKIGRKTINFRPGF